MSRIIEASELILNPDGSVFHLHLLPDEIASTILLVGDPERVALISSYFDAIEVEKSNREFVSKTGYLRGKRISVVSTGIGTDNIDIVLNELDALVNVDFQKRILKSTHTALRLIRLGTSGSLQEDIPVDSLLLSEKAIGFDGLLNFYLGVETITDHHMEQAFMAYLNWNPRLATPYVVDASPELIRLISGSEMQNGVTISAPGFYGPQGRVIRLPIQDPLINQKINAFRHDHWRITNYEMECSAIYGLSKMLGHEAVTICAIIANRLAGKYSKDYHPVVKRMIETVLDKICC